MEEEIGEKIVTPLNPQELCASWPRRRRVAVSVHWLGALIPSLPSSTQFQFQELLPKKEGCRERLVIRSPDTNINPINKGIPFINNNLWWACVEYDLLTLLPDDSVSLLL
jgi:hypothetical protein